MSVCIYNATDKSLTRTDNGSQGYYGEWVSGNTYKKGSEVKHNGIYWIALKTTQAEPTETNAEDWKFYIDASIVDKLTTDESDDLFYNNTRISNIIWSGTKEEYEQALANGEIKAGIFVNIEDDFVEDGADLTKYLSKDDASNLYVQKVTGKGLSTNDLTDELKNTYDTTVSDVNTLKGTGEGSVTKTVVDEIAKVVANAPEDLDTLKEISDWISGHELSAAAMNTAIQKQNNEITELKREIEELKTLITTHINGGTN